MKYLLSIIIFYVSFGLFIYCLMMGSAADTWLLLTTISICLSGLVLDMFTFKDRK